jgi:hypothetical protein
MMKQATMTNFDVDIVLTAIDDLLPDEQKYQYCEHCECGNKFDCDASERCTNASMKEGHGRALLLMRGLICDLFPEGVKEYAARLRLLAAAGFQHADALEEWDRSRRRIEG